VHIYWIDSKQAYSERLHPILLPGRMTKRQDIQSSNIQRHCQTGAMQANNRDALMVVTDQRQSPFRRNLTAMAIMILNR
jgi:hypothetical protein